MPKPEVKNHPSESFYYRKVASQKVARYLSMKGVLPEDWRIVKVKCLKLEDRVCILEITRLE